MIGRGPLASGSTPTGSAGDGELDFGSVGRALWRKKLWVLGPALAIGALAFVGVNMIAPQYRSEARVLIEGRESIFLRPEAERGSERDRTVIDQEAMNSQVQLVLSREVARTVIAQLKLNESPEFDPVLRGGGGLLQQVLVLAGVARDPLRMSPEERVFETYYRRLRAYQIDRSRVIAIEFSSTDPDLAARGANAVSTAYLALLQEVKQDQTRAAGKWLAGEIENLRARVAEAESKVEEFRSKSNLFVGATNSSLSNQQLGEITSQLAVARSQQVDADARAQLIREMLRSGRAIEYSEIINSELIRRLNEQRVTLRAQLAEQSSTLLSGHPRIKELRAQITDLERQIRGEAERLVRALENDAQIAGARVEQLTRNLDQLKKQATSTNEQDVHLRALEREAKAQRDLLESYLAKYREATARETMGATPADARVISQAIVSNTPYFPRKAPIVVIAFLGTLILGVAFVTTGELMAGNVYRLPATAPSAHYSVTPAGAPADAYLDASASSEEMARALRAVAARTAGDAEHSISSAAALLRAFGRSRSVVVGLTAESDAASAALDLARELAANARVVLVNLAAGRRESSGRPGVAELVQSTASFGEIIRRDSGSRVHVIEPGNLEDDPFSLMRSDRVTVVLDALGHAYDHVVVGLGAMPDIANERLAELAPTAILVAPESILSGVEAVRGPLIEAGCRHVVVVSETADEQSAKAA
jgi:polysaccharide biosynthesis transport protein